MRNAAKLYERAIALREQGLSIMGVYGKVPVSSSWDFLKTRFASDHELSEMFNERGADGIAIIAGLVSGNLEMIDVDSSHDVSGRLDGLEEDIVDLFGATFPFVMIKTPSGGWHLYYKCETIGRSVKLASRYLTNAEKTQRKKEGLKVSRHSSKVLIETRGEGGYCVAPPSPNYEILSGTFEDIPTITIEQRDDLMTLLKSYNEVHKNKPRKPRSTKEASETFAVTPWEDYNNDTSDPWKDVLLAYGWTFIKEDDLREYWRKPSVNEKKARSHTATWNKEMRAFFNFSSSCVLEEETPHTPSQLRAIIAFGGDFVEMTATLREEGFGEKYSDEYRRAINKSADLFDDGMSTAEVAATVTAMFKDLDTSKIKTVVKKAEKKTRRDKSSPVEFSVDFVTALNLRRNLLTNSTENEDGKPVTDEFLTSRYIEAKLINGKVGKSMILDICHSDIVPEFDPILDFLARVRDVPFDDEVQQLLGCIRHPDDLPTEDRRMIESMVINWLVQFIAQQHGCPAEIVLILCGAPHTYKTTFFRELLPDELKRYFSIETFKKQNKDTEGLMCETLLMIDDELVGKGNENLDYFKSVVSKSDFKIRKPYGHIVEDRRRRCVFGATANNFDVINGVDDNRRIVPVTVEMINIKKYLDIDRDALFAQLLSIYDEHGNNAARLDEEQRSFLSRHGKEYTIGTNEEDLIKEVFVAGEEGDFISTGAVMARLIEVSSGSMQFTRQTVGRVLAKLARDGWCDPKFRPAAANKDGARPSGWCLRDVYIGSDSILGGDLTSWN